MEPEKRLLGDTGRRVGDDDLTSALVVLFCILAVAGVAWLAYNPVRPKIPYDCSTVTLTDLTRRPCPPKIGEADRSQP